MAKCPICQQKFAQSSKDVEGLCYCSDCGNFFYEGEDSDFEVHRVLKAVYDISFADVLFSHRGIAVVADLSQIEPLMLEVMQKIILSDIPDFRSDITNLEKDDEAGLWGIIEGLKSFYKIEDYCCEYIVRLFAYAMGKIDIVKSPSDAYKEKQVKGIIQEFIVDKPKVEMNDFVVVHWKVCAERHKTVLLKNGEEVFVSKHKEDAFKCAVDSDTTFKLIVLNQLGAELVVDEIKVSVVESVSISFFKIDRNFIIESQSVILSWNVLNAERIILIPEGIDVTQRKSVKVFPEKSTEYQLKAIGYMGEVVEASVAISVMPCPKCAVDIAEVYSQQEFPSLSSFQIPSLPQLDIPLYPVQGPVFPTVADSFNNMQLWSRIQRILSTFPNKLLK